ncbi:Hint domain-containing protein [Pseudaestuariivita atlantica]|uniref:Hedgehog/Intein (Hint) domain-containing protein n=1 Tax=Pseudaestuariivita atlantica TaxID=1317121 RepID=A0A0L1JNX5_9RHOB|nr:Hint domain-containing protein [Pseudaestuariivita atlantica]KNG93459.1 hypothetical protein ATO11_09510 [Pseudaestuariivita atlantica]
MFPDTLPEIDLRPYAVTCFAEGTEISTPKGPRRIEDLQVGDLVSTHDGRVVPIRFNFIQTVFTMFGPAERLMPVRVRAGALGDGLPERDLVLTSDHALLVDGYLINAGQLVNGSSIDYVPLSEFDGQYRVYHIETEDHDLVLAEGVPAETYVDYVGRQHFGNYAEYVALYGEGRPIREMDYPRISASRLVPRTIHARLNANIAAQPSEPEFRLSVAR